MDADQSKGRDGAAVAVLAPAEVKRGILLAARNLALVEEAGPVRA